MKKVLLSVLCLALLLAVMAAGVLGVNAYTAPIVAENERLAEEARLAAEKEKLGDSVLLFDREKPEESTLEVTAETVQKVYADESKQVYTLSLATFQGYTKELPIELTLIVDYEGRIVSLSVDSTGETKELSEDFLPSFEGQDSTLAEVQLVAGVTFSSSAIKNAVNDGFNTLIDNGLFAAAEKGEDQLLNELLPLVFPGLVNKAGAVQGEELAASGSVTGGFKALNGSGCAWFVDNGQKLLAVCTPLGGVSLYDPAGENVTESADAALIEELQDLTAENLEDNSAAQLKALGRLLPEGAEPVAAEIPGLANCITGAWTVETEEGTLYAFAANPYGYANEVMQVYYVLDETGAISAFRVSELILHSEYFSGYTLDEAAYKENFVGMTADSFTAEDTLITGATMSSDAMETATRDVFEAFGLLTGNRG